MAAYWAHLAAVRAQREGPPARLAGWAWAYLLQVRPLPPALRKRSSTTNSAQVQAGERIARASLPARALRSLAGLEFAKLALGSLPNPDVKPRAQAAALREIELIDLFLMRENALGLKGLPLTKTPQFSPLPIAGVEVSIQPDFLVEAPDGRVGAAMLRVTKAPDPDAVRGAMKKEKRGEHRREMALYMVAMMEVLLNEQEQYRGRVDRNLIFVSDVRLGERIGAGPDHTARIGDITSACGQIAALWHGVKPRPGIFKKPDDAG